MKARRQQYVDPEVQGALARRLALHWGIYLVVAAILVVGLQWMVNPFTPFSEHAATALKTYQPVLLVLICLAPIFVYDAIKLSNRFTGPMLRLRTGVRKLAGGERPEKIELRDGDFWQDVATDFNAAVEMLVPEADHVEKQS